LWPKQGPYDPEGAERELLPTKDGVLEMWHARSPLVEGEPKAFILRFYGNADRADRWVAQEARALPCSCEWVGVNYPGFGGSSGRPSLKGVAQSAIVAFDHLRARAGGRPILVFGTSLGSTAALHVSAAREVQGLYIQNPPPLAELIRGGTRLVEPLASSAAGRTRDSGRAGQPSERKVVPRASGVPALRRR
jgi:pimeloyl-ACP methyl ester carboxylesterase